MVDIMNGVNSLLKSDGTKKKPQKKEYLPLLRYEEQMENFAEKINKENSHAVHINLFMK